MHPTDHLIHWSVSEKERLELKEKFRPAYDAIVAKGLLHELNILMHASYTSGMDDEHDAHNEDL